MAANLTGEKQVRVWILYNKAVVLLSGTPFEEEYKPIHWPVMKETEMKCRLNKV